MTNADLVAELDGLLAEAQRRFDSGEQARRDLLSGLAYPPPPGDGDLGVLPWLTDEEADRVRVLRIEAPRVGRDEAQARIDAKIAARRFHKQLANLSFPAEA